MIKVGETKYFNYFKENYNRSFKRPKVDMLHLKELNLQLGSPHLNEAANGCAQTEIDVDKRNQKSVMIESKKT